MLVLDFIDFDKQFKDVTIVSWFLKYTELFKAFLC